MHELLFATLHNYKKSAEVPGVAQVKHTKAYVIVTTAVFPPLVLN